MRRLTAVPTRSGHSAADELATMPARAITARSSNSLRDASPPPDAHPVAEGGLRCHATGSVLITAAGRSRQCQVVVAVSDTLPARLCVSGRWGLFGGAERWSCVGMSVETRGVRQGSGVDGGHSCLALPRCAVAHGAPSSSRVKSRKAPCLCQPACSSDINP